MPVICPVTIAVANETFSLARYAKEDYDDGGLDQKRVVIFKYGQNLTPLDGQLQFDSVEYLTPIAETDAELEPQLDLARASSRQIEKASKGAIISGWYTLRLHEPTTKGQKASRNKEWMQDLLDITSLLFIYFM